MLIVTIINFSAVYINGGLALFGSGVLCNSSDTWNIGSAWCRHIDGYCQMADNSIHHPGGTIGYFWGLIPHGGITAWNLERVYSQEKRGFDMN
jgi:hypothetical protein